MKYKIVPYRALCALEKFTINGITADENDFGSGQDESRETAEPYGCGNYQFSRRTATQEILDKYQITSIEYDQICDELKIKLSFGCCGWCI